MEEIRASNNYEVYAKSTRDEMLAFIPESAKSVLDVGCSVGNFGASLKGARSIEVWGVEVDSAAAEIAATRLDKVRCGPFGSDLDLPEKSFDCIIFNDVLEHMVDPYAALLFAKDLLTDEGCIVASIPNVRYFENVWKFLIDGSWEYTDDGILDRTHLRFFTKRSILAMFSALGFELDVVNGINPVDWSSRKLRQRFRCLNFLSGNRISDMRWLQFVVVARPVK